MDLSLGVNFKPKRHPRISQGESSEDTLMVIQRCCGGANICLRLIPWPPITLNLPHIGILGDPYDSDTLYEDLLGIHCHKTLGMCTDCDKYAR